jgi:hypothetical protein
MRFLSLVGLLVAMVGAGMAGNTVATQAAALTPVVYPGPSLGVAATQHPIGTDFTLTCNALVSVSGAHAAGAAIPAGSGIQAKTGCGEATLILAVPGSGHLQARFAVDDGDTTGGSATVRVRVFGHAGYLLRATSMVITKKDGAKPIDMDVSGATAISFDFPGAPITDLYMIRLTGSARARRSAPGLGNTIPAGAVPVSAASATPACNAYVATQPAMVSRVQVPVAGGIELDGCGVLTFRLPSAADGTFTVRYGTSDAVNYTATPSVLTLRVFDARGRLLRKAVGLSHLGGGLQPLWVSTMGGATLTLTDESSGSDKVEVTGFAQLPGPASLHPNPNHQFFGGSTGDGVAIMPQALTTTCTAEIGSTDLTVGHTPVYLGTYINGYSCGISELSITNAHGHLTGRLGLPGTAIAPASVKIIVLDPNGHPLSQSVVKASSGESGTPFSVSLNNASIVTFLFAGDHSILYDLRLVGQAVVYDRVFPPAEPPVSAKGGTAIDPQDLMLHQACGVVIPNADVLLVHEAAMQFWALDGQMCGGYASLALTGSKYPKHQFSARYGIPAADQTDAIAQLQVSVLNGAGKDIRHTTFTTRNGYGPQTLRISLQGGASLRIVWLKGHTTVFAMTAS